MSEQLPFYPNEELVDELLARQTFAGIIIKPKDPLEEIESKPIIEFDMMWSKRLPESTVKKLLTGALEKLGEMDNV